MSYIIKNNSPILNIKLTDKGRLKLSSGVLNYTYFAVGDSEVNYNYPTPSGLNILKPKDNNPDIKYPLIPNESDPSNFFKVIDYQYVDKNIITNTAKIRGFFTGSSYNTIGLYKQILNANSVDFKNGLTISATTATTGNAYVPVINDMLLISFSGETSVGVGSGVALGVSSFVGVGSGVGCGVVVGVGVAVGMVVTPDQVKR
jgi:hypothetical protein